MKLVWVALGLALMLTGVSTAVVGCGPEQKYCYQQHTTCTQAELDQQKKDEEARMRAEAAVITDPGDAAIVID